MHVILRNLSGQIVTNYILQPEHYSWSALGGPESALVKVSGINGALQNVLDFLRFTVEIYNDQDMLVWWGFVNKTVVQTDASRLSRTLQGYADEIGAFYNDIEGEEKFEGFHRSRKAKAKDQIGSKELLISVDQAVANSITEDRMLEILSEFEDIPITIEANRSGAIGGSLECAGWGTTLEWQHTPYQASGLFGDIDNPIVGAHASVGPFELYESQSGRDKFIAMFADFTMNDSAFRYNGEDNYLSTVSIKAEYLVPEFIAAFSGYGRDNFTMEVWSSTGSNPSKGQQISAPVQKINDGATLSRAYAERTTANSDYRTTLTWRWDNASFLLPKDGWFFVMKTRDDFLSMAIASEPYWYSGSKSNPRNNNYVWVKPTLSRYGGENWIALNSDRQAIDGTVLYSNWHTNVLEFTTRLSAYQLVELLIQRHAIINEVYPSTVPADEKFSGNFTGRETMLSMIKNACAVDELFYTITPNKQVRLYEHPPKPNGTGLSMKADGTLDVKPIGDLSRVVGNWVYTEGLRDVCGLCIGARYEVRTGAYDLSFRGAPALNDVVTRITR